MKETKKHLTVIDGETLMDTRLEPIQFCVDTLLPKGIGILGGASKIGKSWLALDLCLRIAKGEKVWSFESHQGTTLYLCLEDNYQRIQNRLNDITDEVPPSIFFSTAAGTIADGLTEQIENFVKAHDDTVLIIIDTFQMIRENSDYSYANDYHDIGILKKLADRLGICLLLIHHTRKQDDDDPFNMLLGTSGIGGAVDFSFVFKRSKRSQNNATLICTGRDIEYRELEISFSADHMWELIADSVEQPSLLIDPDIVLFSEFMFCIGDYFGGNTELAEMFNAETRKSFTAKSLKQLMNKHRYELENLGVFFESKRTNGQRLVHVWFRSDSSDVSDVKNDSAFSADICVPFVPCVPESQNVAPVCDCESEVEE